MCTWEKINIVINHFYAVIIEEKELQYVVSECCKWTGTSQHENIVCVEVHEYQDHDHGSNPPAGGAMK